MKNIFLSIALFFAFANCKALGTESGEKIDFQKQALKNIVLTNDGRPLKFYPRHNFKSDKGLESYINSVKSILETSSDKELHEIFEDDKKVINLNCVVHKDYVGPSGQRSDYCMLGETDKDLATKIVNMINSGGCFDNDNTYSMPAIVCVDDITFTNKSDGKVWHTNPLGATFFIGKVNLYEKPNINSPYEIIEPYTLFDKESFGYNLECFPSGQKKRSNVNCRQLWEHYSTPDGKKGFLLKEQIKSVGVYNGYAIRVHKKNGKWGEIELLDPRM